MATLATAPSSAAVVVAASAAAAVGVSLPLLHPGTSPATARLRQLRRLSAAPRASSRRPLRLVAAFSPSIAIAPVTKMTSTAAATAASWAAAAVAAPPSLPAIAISVGRMLLDLAVVVGADLSAPWTAVVAGVGRCLDLYREILLVRCLLTWFPNVPWERQPFSAMRDLSDPFLRLFQRIVPPVFGNTLDISSLLAFTVLGVLARILSPPAPTAF